MQAWPPGQAPQQGMHAWLPPGQVQQAWPPLEFGPPTRSGPVGDWPPPTTQPVPGPEPAAAAPEPAASVTAVATLERPEPIPSEALDHPVFFDPAPAVAWWHKQRGALRGRIVSLVLSLVIWAALWWFTREPDNALGWQWGPLSWWIAGISVGVSVLMIVWAAVQFRRAKRAVAALHEGLALGIGRGGLYLDDTLVRWPDLAGLDVHPGRLGGSARLVVRTASGANHTLPLDHLAATPASIDGAIRALSGGRAWLDLTRLDD
ncbi:hypothetical protein [Propioniciclava soli]|uniref:DUF304 domain-containing protein n=1 Tax=Propioniciclava soli TaxID=2775081 RepID=A0ABZ3C6W7_9ACTN|nr:hypothetical protein [Propioniciclava soli]